MKLVTRCSRHVVLIGCLALLLPALASAAPPPPPVAGQDSVRGSGPVHFLCASIEIDAQSGPSGENPTGHVSCGTFFAGPVTCLNVNGNVALITIDSDNFGPVSLRVSDNNGPGTDTVEATIAPGCAQPQPFYADFDFGGDVVVVDAPPLPTSKEQCTNGGWRNYGGSFKTQGDCVSFVAAGGNRKA